MTVAELGRRMDSREFSEWEALYRIEAEDRRRAEMDARARAGLRSRKAGRAKRR